MILIICTGLTGSIRVVHRPNYKSPSSMEYWERGSHARGVYPTHAGYLSHEKSKDEARRGSRHQNNSNKKSKKYKKRTRLGKGSKSNKAYRQI